MHVAHLFTQHGIQVVKQAECTTSIVPFINLMDLVCVSGVPLNLVEHRVFMKFVRDFDKSIQLPSRRTITRRIRIIKINSSILEKVSDSCLYFSFDLWSTRNHRTVMGIKVHFVDNRWNLRNFTLGILDFDGKKEGKEIRRVFLQEIRERYKIQHHQLGIVMADNARVNVNAFGSANVFLEDELISNDPDSSDEDETNVLEEVNGYSEVDACEIIFEDHGEEFFEDGWASKDIPGFIGNINAVIQEAHEAGRRANVPDMVTPDREVELLELSQLLTPFLTLTKELEGDKVTSSLVILAIITLYKQVASIQCTTEYMKALKTSLCLVITERFGAKDQFYYAGRGAKKNLLRVFDNEAYILATLLDPRWKLSPFENEYLQEKRLDRDADPLDYYRKQSEIGRFPILCRLARKYLGIPSTSSSMERVFSITGSLNRARRASLGTKMMEKFVVYREFRKDDIGN
ncbi:unnamed protein product [Allacma fusca]|uniref:HAT C-terminal dimerisation domain-containing protein n=1 Tax=Allacma fusca TaxID=39272 RepID=A0A8J2L512_9HEXA|nr:unnamed protein product [Allacma fusca]